MALDPWRGSAAHRPLGSINRLRKMAYARSQRKRSELDAKKAKDINIVDDIPRSWGMILFSSRSDLALNFLDLFIHSTFYTHLLFFYLRL